MAARNTPNPEPVKAELVISQSVGLEHVRKALDEGTAIPMLDDPEAVAAEMAARVMNATSLAELESEGTELSKIDAVLGKVIEVQHVAWRNSDYNEGAAVYAIVDAIDVGSGEQFKLSVGAEDAVRKLYKLASFDAFPYMIMLQKAEKDTKNGFRPVNCFLKGKRVGEGEDAF